MVFSNHFLRRVERRSINHLYWYSDAIDPVVVVSSYFTLHSILGTLIVANYLNCFVRTVFKVRCKIERWRLDMYTGTSL